MSKADNELNRTMWYFYSLFVKDFVSSQYCHPKMQTSPWIQLLTQRLAYPYSGFKFDSVVALAITRGGWHQE